MKAVTLIDTGSDFMNIGTVILTGDRIEDETLIINACEAHFSAKCKLHLPINWERLESWPGTDVVLIKDDDGEEYEHEIDMQVTALYGRQTRVFTALSESAPNYVGVTSVDEALLIEQNEPDEELRVFETPMEATAFLEGLEAGFGWDGSGSFIISDRP